MQTYKYSYSKVNSVVAEEVIAKSNGRKEWYYQKNVFLGYPYTGVQNAPFWPFDTSACSQPSVSLSSTNRRSAGEVTTGTFSLDVHFYNLNRKVTLPGHHHEQKHREKGTLTWTRRSSCMDGGKAAKTAGSIFPCISGCTTKKVEASG